MKFKIDTQLTNTTCLEKYRFGHIFYKTGMCVRFYLLSSIDKENGEAGNPELLVSRG